MKTEERDVFLEDLYARDEGDGVSAKDMLREHMKTLGVEWEEGDLG